MDRSDDTATGIEFGHAIFGIEGSFTFEFGLRFRLTLCLSIYLLFSHLFFKR
jgi:hypothetical protein